MIKIIYMLTAIMLTATIFSCGGGGGSDPAPVKAKYFDPSQGTNGNGTESSPYNTFVGIIFEAGTSYLVKRGTVLEEQITINASGTAGAQIIIGAYGDTALLPPVIEGSELIDDDAWTDEGGGVYSCSLSPTEFEGRGNVIINDVIQKFVTTPTPGDGEYTIDSSGKMQIYGDPMVSEVRLSRRYFGIKGSGVSYITIKDLQIRQASLHGIQFEDSSHITVQNCKIEMCGGAFISFSPKPEIQAGNGVEFGNSSSACAVEDCIISEIFDSGVTCQTYDNNQTASDFTFSNNTISKCGFAGVEVAVLLNTDKSGSSISDVSVNTSTISSCGDGFSGVRYGSEGRGVKIAADNMAGTISDVTVEQCTIDTSEGEGVYINGDVGIINISRCMVTENMRDGIKLEDSGHTSIGLKVISSIIKDNNNEGISYNSTAGVGIEIYNCTLYNNTAINVSLGSVAGYFRMKNTILYSLWGCHIYSAGDISNISSIDNNCYYDDHTGMFNWASTIYNNLSDFKSAYNVFDVNSTTDSPDLDLNYRPGADAACRDGGALITGVTTDYHGDSFNNPPTIGAVEY